MRWNKLLNGSHIGPVVDLGTGKRIQEGAIKVVKGSISSFQTSGVEVEGRGLVEVDDVVLATGFVPPVMDGLTNEIKREPTYFHQFGNIRMLRENGERIARKILNQVSFDIFIRFLLI